MLDCFVKTTGVCVYMSVGGLCVIMGNLALLMW